MLEISVPAGSPEAVRAAVANGAGTVYLGLGAFCSNQHLGSFNDDELSAAIEYCHIRGVKIYATIDTLMRDKDLQLALRLTDKAVIFGVDAIIVGDPGFLRLLRQVFPDLELCAGRRMCICNLEGVEFAYSAGASRVILAKELSANEIARICAHSPLKIEICVHGPICASYSGLCYMSAFAGKSSANFGICSEPCRQSFALGSKLDSYPLCMKNLSLGAYLKELEKNGVSSIMIEAAYKQPEYVAMTTDVFCRALKSGRLPSAHDITLLTEAFPVAGYTDAYYTGNPGSDMFGYTHKTAKRYSEMLEKVKADYMSIEAQRVPVIFYSLIQRGMPARIAVQDEDGNTATCSGPVPSPSSDKEITSVTLQTQLYKTTGTPYFCNGVKSIVDRGLYLDLADIGQMRSNVLYDLTLLRRVVKPQRRLEPHSGLKYINTENEPELNISVLKADQLSAELAGFRPCILYVPAEELIDFPSAITPFWENGFTSVCAVLPPILHDGEAKAFYEKLIKLHEIHIHEVLVANPGQIEICKKLGFKVRGDCCLNISNSQSLKIYKDASLESVALSYELSFEAINELSKCMNTELIIYGRIPLMITENCIIKASTGVCSCDRANHIKDKRGSVFPVERCYKCRNIVLSSEKIYLADKKNDYSKLGLWAGRLMFTTENAKECVRVAQRYLGLGSYEPAVRTRGLYY